MIVNTLFGRAKKLYHKDDPDTSKEAAEDMVKSGRLSKQEEEVWQTIKYHVNNTFYKDFTAKELVPWRRLDYYLVQRRLSGLHNKGKIERTGAKRGKCRVWRIV